MPTRPTAWSECVTQMQNRVARRSQDEHLLSWLCMALTSPVLRCAAPLFSLSSLTLHPLTGPRPTPLFPLSFIPSSRTLAHCSRIFSLFLPPFPLSEPSVTPLMCPQTPPFSLSRSCFTSIFSHLFLFYPFVSCRSGHSFLSTHSLSFTSPAAPHFSTQLGLDFYLPPDF